MHFRKNNKFKISTILFILFIGVIFLAAIQYNIEYYKTDKYGTAYQGIVTDKISQSKHQPHMKVQVYHAYGIIEYDITSPHKTFRNTQIGDSITIKVSEKYKIAVIADSSLDYFVIDHIERLGLYIIAFIVLLILVGYLPRILGKLHQKNQG